MANQSIRVLFRIHAGAPFRLASDEKQQEHWDALKTIINEWKSSGVNLIGSFGCFGNSSDGYSHYVILEVDRLEKVGEMHEDVFGSELLYEHHSFEVGQTMSLIERVWNEL